MRTLIIAGALSFGLVALPAAADAGSSYQVGVKVNHSTLTLGQKLVFQGHVRPGAAAAGSTVTLQEKYKPTKPWRVVAHDDVSRTGTYRLTYKPHTATERKYRVVMPATSHHKKGTSKRVDVKVFDWAKLTPLESVNGRGMSVDKNIHINGVKYADSLRAQYYYQDASGATAPASIEYNLNHRCTALRGTFGLSDTSESGGQATVSVEADGTQVYSHTFDLGQSEQKKLALDSPLKIHLASVTTNASPAGFGAIGTPEVFCTTPYGG